MAFQRQAPYGFVDGVTRLTAAILNAWNVALSRAVDGTLGGNYTPSAAVNLNGSGIGGVQTDTSLSGTYTFGTGGRRAEPPRGVTITTSDITVRDVPAGEGGSTLRIDSSGLDTTRVVTIDVSEDLRDGETLHVIFAPQHGSHQVRINSEGGGNNPLFSANPANGNNWAWLMFDATRDGTNPLGEWIVLFGSG